MSGTELLSVVYNIYSLIRITSVVSGTSMAISRLDARILAVLYSAYVVYVMNRKSVSLCLPSLMAGNMSAGTAGMILSGQNTAYAFSKLVGGVASDYLKPRRLLGIGLLCCSITTLLFSYSHSDSGFIFSWFLNGLAHGGGWPACAKILQTVAPMHFGTMWSILSTSVNFAGVLSPFVAAFLLPLLGWRWNLRFISGLSVLMGFVCLTAIPEPSTVKISTNKGSGRSSESNLYSLLLNPLIWLISVCYLVVFCAKTALTDWCQIFLINVYDLTPSVGMRFASSMELGGFVGSLVVGYITDQYVQQRTSNAVRVRMICSLACAFGVCVALHLLCFGVDSTSSQVIFMLLGFLLGAFTYGQIVMYGIVASVMVSPHLSGTSHSIVSFAANVGAVLAGFPLANLARIYGWRFTFTFLEVASGMVIFLLGGYINMTTNKVKSG